MNDMKGGFNSSFIEVRTFEGPKFIKDLLIGDLITTHTGYSKLLGVYKRAACPNEPIYNIHCHATEERVIDRISAKHSILVKLEGKPCFIKVSELKNGMTLIGRKCNYKLDRLEKLETINRFFYDLDLESSDHYYVEDICVKSDVK